MWSNLMGPSHVNIVAGATDQATRNEYESSMNLIWSCSHPPFQHQVHSSSHASTSTNVSDDTRVSNAGSPSCSATRYVYLPLHLQCHRKHNVPSRPRPHKASRRLRRQSARSERQSGYRKCQGIISLPPTTRSAVQFVFTHHKHMRTLAFDEPL